MLFIVGFILGMIASLICYVLILATKFNESEMK